MYVVVLGSHRAYHSSACWVFDDKVVAESFASWVTANIDPAQVIRALDPTVELLSGFEQLLSQTTLEPPRPSETASLNEDETVKHGTRGIGNRES